MMMMISITCYMPAKAFVGRYYDSRLLYPFQATPPPSPPLRPQLSFLVVDYKPYLSYV